MTQEPQTNNRQFDLTVPQYGFLTCNKRHPAYVGSWGTGKSACLIFKSVDLCEKYQNNLGVIFRKEYTDLRDSTVRDFELYTGMKASGDRSVKFSNGSEILFRHLEEMNNIQNMNLGFFGIEQAEELETDEYFFKLHGRLRRDGVLRQGFIIANTNGHNWIYKLWKIGNDPDYPLYEMKSKDAVYLPADTLESWNKLEKSKPRLYNRFVLNSWEEADTVDVIIQPAWIYAATKRDLSSIPPIRRIVSIDVARYGDDKTVFYAIENNEVIGREEHEKRSTMETVGLAQIFAKKHEGIESYAVDEIGVGAGVADRLLELEKDVVCVNTAQKSSSPDEYYNLRAEIYSKGADLFEVGRVKIQPDDTDLIEQLSWARYKTIKSNGIYQVEAKEDIKKRYGRSPDNADCFLNGLWALNKIHPEKVIKRDKYARAFEKKTVSNPMSVLG